MPVTRGQIVVRGLTHRCPNCGSKTLFQRGKLIALNRDCPVCGLVIERDEGSFLGSMSLNYGITLIFVLSPIAILWYLDVFSDRVASFLALAGAILFPALFYRSSRSWWLMSYYFFLPQHLPANRAADADDGSTKP